jgi:hypothetical protein
MDREAGIVVGCYRGRDLERGGNEGKKESQDGAS